MKRLTTFRWVALQFGLLGCWRAWLRRLGSGRALPEPPSDDDRPAAHAEALGALLERSRAATTAAELIATYRHWRFPRKSQDAR